VFVVCLLGSAAHGPMMKKIIFPEVLFQRMKAIQRWNPFVLSHACLAAAEGQQTVEGSQIHTYPQFHLHAHRLSLLLRA